MKNFYTKRDLFEKLISSSRVRLVLIPNHKEVILPEIALARAKINNGVKIISLDYDFGFVDAMTDFEVTDSGVAATFRFGSSYEYTYVPWDTVITIITEEIHINFGVKHSSLTDKQELSAKLETKSNKPKLKLV